MSRENSRLRKVFVHPKRGVFYFEERGRPRWKPEIRSACQIEESEVAYYWTVITSIELSKCAQSLPRKGLSSVNICQDCNKLVDMDEMDTHWTTGKKICRDCLIGSNLEDELDSLDVTQVIPIGGIEQESPVRDLRMRQTNRGAK